jgi:two-component system cell cycle response regulator DivK
MRRKRILVVEDNEANLELSRYLLEQEGYLVFSAITAEAAIVAAREVRPDLILMDVGLPEMNGLEATRILKASTETSTACIVAFSAYAMPEDAANARRHGCDGFIAKPIDVRKFRRDIARFLAAAAAPES